MAKVISKTRGIPGRRKTKGQKQAASRTRKAAYVALVVEGIKRQRDPI